MRDLLGIARAMYAAGRSEGAGERRLAEIAQAGQDFKLALGLARRCDPDTIGHRRAWELAQIGYERLLRQIEITTALAPVLEAAVGRVLRG